MWIQYRGMSSRPERSQSCSKCESTRGAGLTHSFFKHCHPHAPFLDVNENSDWRKCRESSALLFLGILQVAARFWGHSSR